MAETRSSLVLEVDGSGMQLTENIVAGSLPNADGVYPADLDDDGNIDIVGTASRPTSKVH